METITQNVMRNVVWQMNIEFSDMCLIADSITAIPFVIWFNACFLLYFIISLSYYIQLFHFQIRSSFNSKTRKFFVCKINHIMLNLIPQF
jgi:hypothetical protein